MVSCWLSVVSGQLSVVSCQWSVVSGYLEEGRMKKISPLLPASCSLPPAPCILPPASCSLLPASYGRWIIASKTRRLALGSVPTKRTYSPGYSDTYPSKAVIASLSDVA